MKKLILFILVVSSFCATAQEWNWSGKEALGRKKWSEMESYIAIKKLSNAQSSTSWLLKNTPKLNVALYINASKVYSQLVKDELSKKTQDKARIMAFQDTALMIFDKRIEYFGDEANVLNRKGKVAYKYLGYREGKLAELHDLYGKIVKLRGISTYDVNFLNYVKVVVNEYKKATVTKEEALKLYLQLHDLIDQKKAKKVSQAKPVDKIEKKIESMESTFAKNVKLNCNDAHTAFESKFNSTPDLKTAKSIYSIMSAGECNDDALYLKSLEYLAKEESNPTYYIALGDLYFNKKDYASSYKWYEGSIVELKDSSKKASVYYDMADIRKKQGKFSDARDLANKSLSFDPKLIKNHTLVANMYMASYDRCKSEDPVKSRAVFIAAYNKYSLSGNSAGMSSAKSQFPSTNDIFMTNRKEGDSIPVGCWIGGTVKAVKR